jgi:hypothetical protein
VRGADRVSSFVLVVFALVAVNEARKLRLGSLSSPGPGFVPLCLAVGGSGGTVILFRRPK